MDLDQKCQPPCRAMVTQLPPPASWAGPHIISLDPNTGPAVGGTTVVITGRNFTGATAVRFGTVDAASFTVDNDTRITAVSPPWSPEMA